MIGEGRSARSGLTFESTVIAPRSRGGLLLHATTSTAAPRRPRPDQRRTLRPSTAARGGIGGRAPRSFHGFLSRFLNEPAARPMLERVDELRLLPDPLAFLQVDVVLAAARGARVVAVDRDLVDLQVDLVTLLDLVGGAHAIDLIRGQPRPDLLQAGEVLRLDRAHVRIQHAPDLGPWIRG